MGVELLRDPEFSALAERCSEASGLDLRYLLVDASDDELTLTQHAQPALLFAGVALGTLCQREGLSPAAVAGHSAGEYSALTVAGACSLEEAMRAIAERGRAMAEAAPPGTSTMAAVLGLSSGAVANALAGVGEVWPANFNTPTQVVIGGSVAGIDAARERLLAAGARRVLPLNVAAAFHTPLMASAAGRLRAVLDTVPWQTPRIPVVANVSAAPYPDGAAAPWLLERQLSSPVRWADCVETLCRLGCDSFLELGPRRALSGMLRELAPEAGASVVATPEAVSAYMATATAAP